MRRQRRSGASDDGGGSSPAWGTTSPAPRAAPSAQAVEIASNDHRNQFYCPLHHSHRYSLGAVDVGDVEQVFRRIFAREGLGICHLDFGACPWSRGDDAGCVWAQVVAAG